MFLLKTSEKRCILMDNDVPARDPLAKYNEYGTKSVSTS